MSLHSSANAAFQAIAEFLRSVLSAFALRKQKRLIDDHMIEGKGSNCYISKSTLPCSRRIVVIENPLPLSSPGDVKFFHGP